MIKKENLLRYRIASKIVSGLNSGFTIIEVLIVAVILITLVASTISLLVVTTSPLASSEKLAKAQAAIDSDLSKIRKLAEDYTCCAGTCSIAQTAVSTCNGNANDSTYYYPSSTGGINTSVTSAIATFKSLCVSTNVNSTLLTTLAASSTLPIFNQSDVDRDTPVINPSSHTLTFVYRVKSGTSAIGQSGSVLRVAVIRPNVANWCE